MKENNFFVKIIILLIRFYQLFISPIIGKSCRFYPTCSEYTVQSLKKHGFFKGCKLSFLRIIKCHPFNQGGYDPVK